MDRLDYKKGTIERFLKEYEMLSSKMRMCKEVVGVDEEGNEVYEHTGEVEVLLKFDLKSKEDEDDI